MCLGIEGQPPCSCQNATGCLDNADSCNSTVSPPECYCSTNAPNFTVCETGKTCLNISNQPSCSCLDATDCSDSADSCNVTLSPPLCTCSSNTPTFEPCENGAICQNIARQPPCSCIDNSTCPSNADYCNITASPSACMCSSNGPSYEPCEVGSECIDIPGQPPCSCFDVSDCLGNTADTCNTTMSPTQCTCSTNWPNYDPCEEGRECIDIDGQPPCSCLDATHCGPGHTCNTTASPATCVCSSNAPTFDPCDEGSECLNIPGQPACSCVDAAGCLDNADTCNTTTSPPTCTCSSNPPYFEPCEEGSVCIDIPGQPPCSCQNATGCFETADTCNTTAYPPTCTCSANAPSFEPCEEGSICLSIPNQPACSCQNATGCPENADTCNNGLCECTFNEPTFEPCEIGSTCINITGQPPCSCINATGCLENADYCNVTTTPSTCQCLTNSPTFAACDEGCLCLDSGCVCPVCDNSTNYINTTTNPPTCQCLGNSPTFEPCTNGSVCLDIPGQPACSCQNATECLENADTCEDSTCKCGTEEACPLGVLCINNFNVTGFPGPFCGPCNDTSMCPSSANECDASTNPPSCKCNGGDPCLPGSTCEGVKEGEPPCSCLSDDYCDDYGGDSCDLLSCPPVCRCGDGPGCAPDGECINGTCQVLFCECIYMYKNSVPRDL